MVNYGDIEINPTVDALNEPTVMRQIRKVAENTDKNEKSIAENVATFDARITNIQQKTDNLEVRTEDLEDTVNNIVVPDVETLQTEMVEVQTEVAKIPNAIEQNDLEFTQNAVHQIQKKIDADAETIPLQLADSSHSGFMSSADHLALGQAVTDIEDLKEIKITYPLDLTAYLPEPTPSQITQEFESEYPDVPIVTGIKVADYTNSLAYVYNGSTWITQQFVGTIPKATQTTIGGVKNIAQTTGNYGKIYVENDATMSMLGYDEMHQDIDDLLEKVGDEDSGLVKDVSDLETGLATTNANVTLNTNGITLLTSRVDGLGLSKLNNSGYTGDEGKVMAVNSLGILQPKEFDVSAVEQRLRNRTDVGIDYIPVTFENVPTVIINSLQAGFNTINASIYAPHVNSSIIKKMYYSPNDNKLIYDRYNYEFNIVPTDTGEKYSKTITDLNGLYTSTTAYGSAMPFILTGLKNAGIVRDDSQTNRLWIKNGKVGYKSLSTPQIAKNTYMLFTDNVETPTKFFVIGTPSPYNTLEYYDNFDPNTIGFIGTYAQSQIPYDINGTWYYIGDIDYKFEYLLKTAWYKNETSTEQKPVNALSLTFTE